MRCARRLAISAICCIILFWGLTAYADTHWANIAGSNTPPFTSYLTGAHQIQDAIDASGPGDTVRIAAGLYRPDTTISLKDSIAVIGAGRDSTIIIPLYDVLGWGTVIIFELLGPMTGAGGGITLKGCTIRGYDDISPDHIGIWINYKKTAPSHISNNAFYNCRNGLYMTNADAVVENNYFDSCTAAVIIGGGGSYEIHHNVMKGRIAGIGTSLWLTAIVRIHHNSIFTYEWAPIIIETYGDSAMVHNNLMVTPKSLAIGTYCDCAGMVIRNNTIVRTQVDPRWIFVDFQTAFGSETVVENNVFWALNGEIEIGGGFTDNGVYRLSYNDFWGLDSGTTGSGLNINAPDVILDTVGSIYRDPMFTNDSAYYLQLGSPLIDAGNPALHDPDLTRSDIGWTGGMDGMLYDYPEQPPDAPDTLMSTNDGDSLYLMWPMNQEADLDIYRIYRGLVADFPLDAGSVIAELAGDDTTFVYPIGDSSSDMFFKITALDTAGLESAPSNEIAVLSTSVFEEDVQSNDSIPGAPSLTAYPNPFNSVTTIRFIVPQYANKNSHVNITVYDILGARIANLVDDRMAPGPHTVVWQGVDNSGRRLASGIYFASMRTSGFEGATCTKLLLLK